MVSGFKIRNKYGIWVGPRVNVGAWYILGPLRDHHIMNFRLMYVFSWCWDPLGLQMDMRLFEGSGLLCLLQSLYAGSTPSGCTEILTVAHEGS